MKGCTLRLLGLTSRKRRGALPAAGQERRAGPALQVYPLCGWQRAPPAQKLPLGVPWATASLATSALTGWAACCLLSPAGSSTTGSPVPPTVYTPNLEQPSPSNYLEPPCPFPPSCAPRPLPARPTCWNCWRLHPACGQCWAWHGARLCPPPLLLCNSISAPALQDTPHCLAGWAFKPSVT